MTRKLPTRLALINVALRLFGDAGYNATSTRQIAQAADANISAISYHFGGKAGLRLACAEFVAERLMTATVARLSETGELSAQDACKTLEGILRSLVNMFLLQPHAKEMSQFMLREMAQSEEMLDTIFPKLFEPVHKSFCALWQQATGQDAMSDQVKLTVFSMVGQVVYFRIGQDIVSRRMGWENVGNEQAEAIANVICANLHATIALAKKGSNL
jgi:AcrR family transcriptional regulator